MHYYEVKVLAFCISGFEQKNSFVGTFAQCYLWEQNTKSHKRMLSEKWSV